VSDVGAVSKPLNRPRLDEKQIVVGRIVVGPLKRLRPIGPTGCRPLIVVQDGVEVVRITLGNCHVSLFLILSWQKVFFSLNNKKSRDILFLRTRIRFCRKILFSNAEINSRDQQLQRMFRFQISSEEFRWQHRKMREE